MRGCFARPSISQLVCELRPCCQYVHTTKRQAKIHRHSDESRDDWELINNKLFKKPEHETRARSVSECISFFIHSLTLRALVELITSPPKPFRQYTATQVARRATCCIRGCSCRSRCRGAGRICPCKCGICAGYDCAVVATDACAGCAPKHGA